MNVQNIAIIEDQEVFRKFAVNQLKSEVNFKLHLYESAESFLANRKHPDYDLLYVDLRLKDMDGLDLIQEVGIHFPEWKCVVFSNLMDDEKIVEAIKRGAVGYLFKSEIQNLAEITKVFLSGGSVISPSIAIKVLKNFKNPIPSGFSDLSYRERQVLDELVKGSSAEMIAEYLQLSYHTVRTHIRFIYKKMQVNNRVSLMKKMSL